MREFFNADEAAAELQRLTQTSWTAAQVMREAEKGSLPICFQYQGKIGVFNRQESELVRAIFGNALRTGYLPRGSYLRVQGHPVLTDAHQKQDELQARNLELVNSVNGAFECRVAPSETLRIVADSGGFKGTAAAPFRVPSSGWLFHTDDLNALSSTTQAAPIPSRSAPAQPRDAAPAPVAADSASNTPAWIVAKPQRYSGYTAPLHRLIAAAHREGDPRPTAREVVDAWRINAPAEIAKMLPDGFDYYDAKGDTKTADLEAIRKAIGRMTSPR